MKFNPDRHHRRSIRLKGYDYSSPGYYYITICTQNRECLFGTIKNGKMINSNAGDMINKWWFELKKKYKNIELDEFIIMPNHLHGIIILQNNVGANLCVCPENLCVCPGNLRVRPVNDNIHPVNDDVYPENRNIRLDKNESDNAQAHLDGRTNQDNGQTCHDKGQICQDNGQTHRSAPTATTIGETIQWFKTMSTNEYIVNVKQNDWEPFNKRLWQRNYYEHIIRDEQELNRIREYIRQNPYQWGDDKENPDNK